MRFLTRKIVLWAALSALSLIPAHGQSPTPGKTQIWAATEPLTEYLRPHRLVDIGGRKLNLMCMGTGDRTIIFDAGGSDWSVIWALVQPKVAKRTSACTYDRAGLGYSDPAVGPRSPIAIVEDLHALVHAGGLKTPLILVGHSLGGFNVKLYAALYPEDVAGLVLVDPAEERSSERVRQRMRKHHGTSLSSRIELADHDAIQRLIGHYEHCSNATMARDLDPQSIIYKRCSDPVRPALGPLIATERARIQVRRSYQEAQASEIVNSVYGRPIADPVYRDLFRQGMFGAKPLIVLSHSKFDARDPIDAADFQAGLWLHRETAGLSRHGRHHIVPNTSHNIEIDAPDAVVDAIFEVLDRLGLNRNDN